MAKSKNEGRIEFEQVFARELESIEARWDAAYTEDRGARALAADRRPDVEHQLVGLGLSGGGIRSATFNLGVLQALARHGVFQHIDYLSTVSGGGYLGSAISTVMRKAGAPFPFHQEASANENPHVSWLRNHSNYMVENGVFDYLRITAVMIRGMMLNFLILVPLLLLLAVAMDWLFAGWLHDWAVEGLDPWDVYQYSLWTTGALLLYFISYPPVVRLFRLVESRRSVQLGSDSTVKARDRYELSFATMLLLVLLIALFETIPVALHGFHRLDGLPGSSRELLASVTAVGSVLMSVGAGKLAKALSGLLKGVVMAALWLVGIMIPLLVVLFVGEALVYDQGTIHDALIQVQLGPWHQQWHTVVGVALIVAGFCWLFLDINLTAILGMYRDRLAEAYLVGRNSDDVIDIEEDVNFDELNQPGSLAPYHLINTALNLQGSKDPFIRERGADFFVFSKLFAGGRRTGYVSTRDLEAVFPQLDVATGMAISAAAASPNMGSYTNSSLVALMTLLNVRMGYWIPNPARLGPWAAKRGPLRPRLRHRVGWRVRPRLLIHEMFSRLDDRRRWINLSDGGHIENLATIELLRRRCKYIIIGDAEADPRMAFNGLAVLMRQARLDLGIEIEIVTDDLGLDAQGLSGQHCALGRILYPPREPGGAPQEGRLLYIKLSVTGDEDQLIREYRARKPNFPHESTADQFFDEGQFEAYRSLGDHVASGLFERLSAGLELSFEQLGLWFRGLEADLAPKHPTESSVATLGAMLLEIQGHLIEPALQAYYDELHPEARSEREPEPEPAVTTAARHRAERFVIAAQLQLMERAFESLDLGEPSSRRHERNAGWMSLFQRWADSSTFKRGYFQERGVHGGRFRNFCAEVLGLPES